MILSTKVNSVNIHTPIISPIIRQRNNKLDPSLGRSIDHSVKPLNIDRGLAILPSLKVDACITCALSSVLRETVWISRGISVVEAPGTHNVQAGLFSCRKAAQRILFVLQLIRIIHQLGLVTYILEGEVVSVTPSKIKILAIELKLVTLDSNKVLLRTLRTSLSAQKARSKNK